MVVHSQPRLNSDANIKEMGWLKKEKHTGSLRKISKNQDRKHITICRLDRKCTNEKQMVQNRSQ